MTQKSYNIQALRGHNYSDTEFQADMAQSGINIPDQLLYRPELNEFVAKAMYDQNVTSYMETPNPFTQKNYTEKEAHQQAKEHYNQVMDNVSALMKIDKEYK